MREVAASLRLSHQRVHQIVESAGGGRRWRKGHDASDDARRCSFCGRDGRPAKALVAGPGVFICRRCVDSVDQVLATGQTATAPVIEPVDEEATGARCSFCGERRGQVGALAVAPNTASRSGRRKWAGDVQICGECLVLCREILEERLT